MQRGGNERRDREEGSNKRIKIDRKVEMRSSRE